MPNMLSGCFRAGSLRPLRVFAQGQCIPASAIMNLGGMSMNIQRKNSAHHFCMQSEREQTLVLPPIMYSASSFEMPLTCFSHKTISIRS